MDANQDFLEYRINLHKNFWNRTAQKHPILSYRQGDFFFSRHYKAARHLLVEGKIITPEMLIVDDFLPDYERMYQKSLELGQSAFWTAEPFTGIPWMEAMLGCGVVAGADSFTSSHIENFSDAQVKSIKLDYENPWLKKYLEFTNKLVELSEGRFPIGQPIMRGPTDIIGAMIGQTEMIYFVYENPELFAEMVNRVTDVFLDVMELQKKQIPLFHGGSSIGFYHVWAPGSCIWYQDDLSSILSPDLYARYFIEAGKRICSSYDKSAIHLHPSSFFILDSLLAIDDLDIIEVNKDIGGPSVEEMLPTLQKIMKKKRLILWGDLTLEDLDIVKRNLPVNGLFLNIVTEDLLRIEEIQKSLSS
jgi:hypothetical protein